MEENCSSSTVIDNLAAKTNGSKKKNKYWCFVMISLSFEHDDLFHFLWTIIKDYDDILNVYAHSTISPRSLCIFNIVDATRRQTSSSYNDTRLYDNGLILYICIITALTMSPESEIQLFLSDWSLD